MAVPIDLLSPILDDLLTRGQVQQPPRPWLGVLSAESDGEVVVMSVSDNGPAAKAGIQRGDIISDIRDGAVEDLPTFTASSGIPARPVPKSPSGSSTADLRNWVRVKSADRNASFTSRCCSRERQGRARAVWHAGSLRYCRGVCCRPPLARDDA